MASDPISGLLGNLGLGRGHQPPGLNDPNRGGWRHDVDNDDHDNNGHHRADNDEPGSLQRSERGDHRASDPSSDYQSDRSDRSEGTRGSSQSHYTSESGSLSNRGHIQDSPLDLPLSQLAELGHALGKAQADTRTAPLQSDINEPASLPATTGTAQGSESVRAAVVQANRANLSSSDVIAPGNAATSLASDRALAQAGVQRGDALLPADRLSTTQTQLPGQVLPIPQGRIDGVPVPLTPQIAGVTVLANAQASNTNRIAGNGREAAPGPLALALGHTVEAGQRRLRERGLSQPLQRWLAARRRALPVFRDRHEDAGGNALQWAFWLLTIVAYGALVLALVSLVPGDTRLFDEAGRPSGGGITLAIGIVAALLAWGVSWRRSARRRPPSTGA